VSEAFVVDASMAFAWVLPSQGTPAADALLTRIESGATPVVPSLWFLEVANGLLAAQRRNEPERSSSFRS
jgi:predicted nucleic acid-binding protein